MPRGTQPLCDFISTLRKMNGSFERGAERGVVSYVCKDSFPHT